MAGWLYKRWAGHFSLESVTYAHVTKSCRLELVSLKEALRHVVIMKSFFLLLFFLLLVSHGSSAVITGVRRNKQLHQLALLHNQRFYKITRNISIRAKSAISKEIETVWEMIYEVFPILGLSWLMKLVWTGIFDVLQFLVCTRRGLQQSHGVTFFVVNKYCMAVFIYFLNPIPLNAEDVALDFQNKVIQYDNNHVQVNVKLESDCHLKLLKRCVTVGISSKLK